VVATHVDNDVSAYSGKRRPGYLALLEAIEAGRVDVVVAWHPDRLHRSPLELEGFIAAVEKADVAVYTVTAGQWDLSTATGRFFARQLGGVARYESEHRSERLRAKLEQNAHRGVTHGRPTYGWRVGYDENRNRRDVLDPTEAEVVRGIARDILAGKSIRSITKDLNESGVASPRGGEWRKGMVRHLVLRPRNAGIRVHRGQEIGEGTWEPLLDRGTFEQVRAVLADPARRTSVGTAAVHLLSGIARCGVCGASMRFAMNRTVPSYRCSGRGCVSRRAEDVDWLVTEVVLGRLAVPTPPTCSPRPAGRSAPKRPRRRGACGRGWTPRRTTTPTARSTRASWNGSPPGCARGSPTRRRAPVPWTTIRCWRGWSARSARGRCGGPELWPSSARSSARWSR
jgi:site-specific DNA recombinase